MLNSSFFKNSFYVLLLRVSGVILLFFLSLFLTNFYSANLVGKYDFVRSTIMLLSGISLLGTNQAIIYYSGVLSSKNSFKSIKAVYVKMLSIIFSMSTFIYLLFLSFSKEYVNEIFEKQEAYDLINISIQGLFFYSIALLNIDTIRALKKTLLSELFRNIFRYLPIFIFAIVLYFLDQTEMIITWFVVGFILLFFITGIAVYVIFDKIKYLNNKTENISTKEIISTSYPMALSAISYFIMQSIDVIFLGIYNSFETIAYYSIAVKLSSVAALAIVSVNIVIAPKIAKIYKDNNFDELRVLMKKATRLNVAVSIPILLCIIIFSTYLLSFFGSDYTLAKNSLIILASSQLFNSISGPSAIFLNMTGRQKSLNIILIIALLINVTLNVILIPILGMIGAALSTAISLILWKTAASALVYSLDNIKTFLN
jgi:O-antigen/teichoic acid export membrane protein